MSIFKACSKKLKILIFQKPNLLHGRFPKQRTPINSRFSEKFRKQTCFSKLFTGNNSQPEKYILLLKITNCLNHCPQTA